MLASPNSANNPKYVLFTTLTYRVPAMFPTLRQHSREFKTRFDGKFDANSPATIKKAGTPACRTKRHLRRVRHTALDECFDCHGEIV
jgi:hypothetical protein